MILAAVYILGTGRAITLEESSRDTIDKEFDKLIVNEDEESAVQNEAIGILRLTGEASSASPETSSYDASSESTNNTVAAAVYVTTPHEQTGTRRKRSVAATPELSCFSGIYRLEALSKGIKVKIPVCRDVASARGKCLGATFKTYGKRACELSHYVKMNIGGGIFSVATNCSCKA